MHTPDLIDALDPRQLTISRGLEKESLRVTPDGLIAQTPHPSALGRALTHPFITTDYSEALLEFITPPEQSISQTLAHLQRHHQFTSLNLNDEVLWPSSMPCVMKGSDDSIPVALYGTSNSGKMKTTYRLGLGHRYGRVMQTIAGVHYNFSINDECWQQLRELEGSTLSLNDYKSAGYLRLIRNFRRYFWLLMYLYGSAPTVCKSFVGQGAHKLIPMAHDSNTLHSPFATSLRMGDLGYQSSAQEQLVVNYNSLQEYIDTLTQAIIVEDPNYNAMGLRNSQGQHKQLNTGLLQIENEFYSVIRPKRTSHFGETALAALNQGGIEYIEVRCLDVNPYEPLGISRQQMVFLDTFLTYCLLSPSPESNLQEYRGMQHNQKQVVYQGRDPQLVLYDQNTLRPLREWGQSLIADMARVAPLLDKQNSGEHHEALGFAKQALEDDSLTLSARLLKDLREQNISFYQLSMNLAQQHKQQLMANPNQAMAAQYQALAKQSIAEQAKIEADDKISFDDYIAQYYSQYERRKQPRAKQVTA